MRMGSNILVKLLELCLGVEKLWIYLYPVESVCVYINCVFVTLCKYLTLSIPVPRVLCNSVCTPCLPDIQAPGHRIM